MIRLSLVILLLLLALPQPTYAQFDPAGFKQALKLKKNIYFSDSTISGGDGSVSDFRVSQIRLAANKDGYDRIVLELQGNDSGSKSALTIPPFYMVENDSNNKRVLITLFGKVKQEFSRQIASQQARRTKFISHLEFLPLVDTDRWSWLVYTQVPVKAEVFELTSPSRIIIDLKP